MRDECTDLHTVTGRAPRLSVLRPALYLLLTRYICIFDNDITILTSYISKFAKKFKQFSQQWPASLSTLQLKNIKKKIPPCLI